MIAVTKMFIPSTKMTVLAHYLTFPLSLQWQNVYFYKKEAGKILLRLLLISISFIVPLSTTKRLLRSLFELIEV